MKQKHFIDIQNIREESTDLRDRNTQAFDGDVTIQITEKADGSNACASYDPEEDVIYAFSRKQTLNFKNTLNGFWNFVQQFSEDTVAAFKAHSNYRVFGEWMGAKNKIVYYDTGKVKHWYIYDIFDITTNRWMSQNAVKTFCEEAGLEYIHELYYGKFISWEHCRSFMKSPAYGETQEGIVCKCQNGLEDWDSNDTRSPLYLKIVNEEFKESMKTREKVVDPAKEEARQEIQKIMESIVTKNRVEKEIHKMQDEGILPNKIEPKEFKIVAQNLPKRIFDDIIKEERELVLNCGGSAGKICSSITMKIARNLVLGSNS